MSSNTGDNPYKKILPTYLLIILLPAFFIIFLYSLIVSIDKNHDIENIKSKLSERATDFMIKTTPIDYYKPRFQKLVQTLSPYIDNINLKEISRIIEESSLNSGVNFRCALFDKDSNLINNQNLLDYEQRFFSYAWKDIHNIENADYPNRAIDEDLIMGTDFNSQIMKNQSENCIPTFNSSKKGLFYSKNLDKQYAGIIIFIEYSKSNLEIIEDKAKELTNLEQPIILYDKSTKEIKNNTFSHKVISFEESVSERFLDGFIDNNIVWKGFDSDNYKLLFGQKIEQPNKYRNHFIIFTSIILIVLILVSIFFFKNYSNKEGMYLSIRYKLIFLFSLAVYMPTLSLWVLSYTTLDFYRTATENSLKKGMLDVLNNIDNDYKFKEEEIRNCFIKLDNYLASFSGKKAPTSEEVEQKLKEIVGENNTIQEMFNWLDIWNIDQTQIYTTNTNESNSRTGDISRVIELLCLDRFCPERLNKAGVKLSQSDIMVGNLFENPISGFAYIFERPEQIIFQNFNEVGAYWWWNYYPDHNNPVAFCFGNSHCRHNTVSYFKSLAQKRFTYEQTNLRIVNLHYATQMYVPESASNNEEIKDLINLSNLNKTVESAKINYENQKYICLCLPGSRLKDCFCLCMYPISEIDYKIDRFRSSIYTFMLLLLVISIFTGLLLSQNFITPIKELDRGLIALKNRNTDTQIEIKNRDELGNLGNAFNQMMIEIKDLLLAGAVQQCLIPTGKYKLEGYDCIVYNQMAADVGGDYADLFEISEDKVLVVIGDVTGHGVSSSILTAMVKASIYDFVKHNIPLNEVVTYTSNMICDLLKKKKLMTFCAIILDKNTGELSICNAGHPNPMIKSQGIGSLRTVGMPSIPMGVSKKRSRYTIESDYLGEGETLFLYTDGFPEAENDKGEMFGYNEFNKLITDYQIQSAEKMKDYLLEVFKNHHGEAELADDITFIILRRNPLQYC